MGVSGVIDAPIPSTYFKSVTNTGIEEGVKSSRLRNTSARPVVIFFSWRTLGESRHMAHLATGELII